MAELPQYIRGEPYLLVTSPGAGKRGWIDKIKKIAGPPAGIIDTVEANPSFLYLEKAYPQALSSAHRVIVAMGGGSVIDTAKALSVRFDGERTFQGVRDMVTGKSPWEGYRVTPVIAIPTTAGTGSEVTPWGTLWDMENKKKYSIHTRDLWCRECIIDPELTYTMGWDLTVSTGLDALSHSLEAIWNRFANPVSTDLAVSAIKKIIATLPALRNNPHYTRLRSIMMLGATQAGLAFSNTRTSLAHGISYYLTANLGIPHGLACSFTLPAIARYLQGKIPWVDKSLKEALGHNPAEALDIFFNELRVSTVAGDYSITPGDIKNMRNQLLSNPRSGNFPLSPVEAFDEIFDETFKENI